MMSLRKTPQGWELATEKALEDSVWARLEDWLTRAISEEEDAPVLDDVLIAPKCHSNF